MCWKKSTVIFLKNHEPYKPNVYMPKSCKVALGVFEIGYDNEIKELNTLGYYMHWIILNLYPIGIHFNLTRLKSSWTKGKWMLLERIFKSIFSNFEIMKLVNGFKIEKLMMVIIKLNEILENIISFLVFPVDHGNPTRKLDWV